MTAATAERAERYQSFDIGCDYRFATLLKQGSGLGLFMGKPFRVTFEWPEGEPEKDRLADVLKAFIARGEALQRETRP